MARSAIVRYTALLCVSFLLVSCSKSHFFGNKTASPQGENQITQTDPDGLTKDQLAQIQQQMDQRNQAIHALEEKITRLEQKIAVLEKNQSGAEKNQPGALQKPDEKPEEIPEHTNDQSKKPAPSDLYQKARNLMLADDFAAAGRLFQRFARQYPDHSLADNSLYWLGECYYSQGEYARAAAVFKDLVTAYPAAEKVPDALLKTGYCYLSMDDTNRANHYLKLVLKKYPFSPAADKAQAKLMSSD